MKVLILNGSPHANGNTAIAVKELAKTFEAEGVEAEICNIGNKNIRGCIACHKCGELGHCVFDDDVNEGRDPLTNFQWGFIALNFKKGKYYLGKEMKLKYFI